MRKITSILRCRYAVLSCRTQSQCQSILLNSKLIRHLFAGFSLWQRQRSAIIGFVRRGGVVGSESPEETRREEEVPRDSPPGKTDSYLSSRLLFSCGSSLELKMLVAAMENLMPF
ncbi:hypothetical protein K1719_003133 [Acacia pycnantha]|nr:hypothetical protein K1719_003133 [Acacia pycnantha]